MARERPSEGGAILGAALARIADKGYRDDPSIPERCATCAFREGSMPNQMGATLIEAMKCTTGVDTVPFGCHHGMHDGSPAKLCAGFVAAKAAPYDFVRDEMERAGHALNLVDPDTDQVRAEFDAWAASVNPDGSLDDYQLARLYAKVRTKEVTPC